MKKFLFVISSLMAAGCILQSCSDNLAPIRNASDGIILNVSSSSVNTKASAGDSENLINSVFYFIYKDGDLTGSPVLKGFFSGLNITDSKTWNIPVSAAQINELFPDGTGKCHTLVIANPPSEISGILSTDGTDVLSVNYIRSLTFVTNLKGIQPNFVMVYDADVNYTAGSPLTIDAGLMRLANKLTIKAETIKEKIDPETGVRWISALDDAKVHFYYGMNKTDLAGDYDAVKDGLAKSNHFVSDEVAFDADTKTSTLHYVEIDEDDIPEGFKPTDSVSSVPDHPTSTSDKYIKCADKYYDLSSFDVISAAVPFYSYPMKWEFTDKYEPYIFIELPWKNASVSTSQFVPVYYKVMLSDKSMGCNNWYDITIKLDVLGSFDKVSPVEQYLHEEYLVKDWQMAWDVENENVQADILESRFIVLPNSEFVLNNQTRTSIPFTSSHPCDFEIVEAYQYNYYKAIPTQTDKKAQAVSEEWITKNGSVLEFEHALNNDLDSGELDCAPYEIKVKIYHSDAPAYYQYAYITQYPSMYVRTYLNSDVNPVTLANGTHRGYTYVNGAQGSGYQNVPTSYGSSAGIESCNLSVVTVTQFDENSGYEIGDPRRSTYLTNAEWNTIKSGIGSSTFASSQSLENGRINTTPRQLQYYYPTSSDANNVVAPKLRLCSGYAANGGDRSYNNNLLRCATYQEDGYPAGRWRLPTAAEIQYIRKLANHELILSPFATGTAYWCAGGYVDGSGEISYSTSGTHSSRCVYDEWYWEVVDNAPADDENWRPIGTAGTDDLTKFTWGDQLL